jgi:hypothetical protein
MGIQMKRSLMPSQRLLNVVADSVASSLSAKRGCCITTNLLSAVRCSVPTDRRNTLFRIRPPRAAQVES